MTPPFSGVDVVRVMRAEFDDEQHKRQLRQMHEADKLDARDADRESQSRLASLRRLLGLSSLRPNHPKT